MSMFVTIKFMKNTLGNVQQFEVYMIRFYPTWLSVVVLLGCTTKDEDSDLTDATSQLCLTESTPIESFVLFPELPTTQIHADIAFDGQWVWTVFNLPNDDSDFDVYLGAIDCTGSVVVDPKQVLSNPLQSAGSL